LFAYTLLHELITACIIKMPDFRSVLPQFTSVLIPKRPDDVAPFMSYRQALRTNRSLANPRVGAQWCDSTDSRLREHREFVAIRTTAMFMMNNGPRTNCRRALAGYVLIIAVPVHQSTSVGFLFANELRCSRNRLSVESHHCAPTRGFARLRISPATLSIAHEWSHVVRLFGISTEVTEATRDAEVGILMMHA